MLSEKLPWSSCRMPRGSRIGLCVTSPDEEIVQVLEQIDDRVTRLLRRCGRLPEDPSPPIR